MERILKVEGHEGLVKDPVTGSIMNNDLTAFELAVQQKDKRLKEIQRVDDLESKVEQLESLIRKLLEEK